MCARLYLVLHDREQYQKLIDLPEEQSQSLLNLLQTLLDSPSLDPSFRSPFMNALLRISRKTGLYPEILLQNRVVLEGEDAVAAGQFGDVWKGTYGGQKVAVKVLKLYVQSDITKHLKKVSYETLIWRQLRHRNVLPFLCLYYVNNNRARIGLVSPWMENGNVQQYLRKDPQTDRVSLARDVAKGLEYLHTMSPGIVHGDLKAVNILITDTHRACLADFGLSTASQSQALNLSSFSAGKAGGTSRWTAPELLNGTQEINNTNSDVYAFGCVLYEIFSGNIPFYDINSDYPVILKVMQGIRPPRPSHFEPSGESCDSLGLDDHMWNILEDCWLPEPTSRPGISEVVARLPKRPISTTQPNGIRQYPSNQDLIPWAISNRDARTPADESPINITPPP
ncbi:kinase-like domain-containing protein [Collybia nuda]|uniref:Kinase-like domain-containing protein n=1 Tax=Collybia nuda TaxID=64659 RepID=A0A9P5Y173_9AGAR|nr:kinase-like domain-containing protein [Collybia nuda]